MNEGGFRFHLGSPALNFSATLRSRGGRRIERIPAPSDLGRWLTQARLLPAGIVPTPSEYDAAISLREAIYAVGDAVLRGAAPDPEAVAAINRAAREGQAVAQLDPHSLERRSEARSPVRAGLSAVAEDAIEVFSGERRQLTRCDDPQCSALLLSRSRGPRRRWCSMETCGNRAKVAAYRARRG